MKSPNRKGAPAKCFVKHWLHAEHLLVDHRKMSKSLGNFYTLRDLLKKGYTGTEVRMLLLSAHYRTQLNFTMEGLDAARTTLERLADFVDRLKAITQKDAGGEIEPLIATTRQSFKDALADDLNISQAFAALFEFVRKVNQLCDSNKVGGEEAKKALAFLKELDQVLAIIPFKRKELEIPEELVKALEQREQARLTKNWAEADKQRAIITAAGYLIEDTPSGSRLKKNESKKD